MTHHFRSTSERGVRRGITGVAKRTAPDLLIGLALIYVGAIPLSLMLDGYLRGLVHGVLLVLVPGLLVVHLLWNSGAAADAGSLDDDDAYRHGSQPSVR